MLVRFVLVKVLQQQVERQVEVVLICASATHCQAACIVAMPLGLLGLIMNKLNLSTSQLFEQSAMDEFSSL